MASHRAANNQTPENSENVMASWEQDFPSLTNSTTYPAPRPRFTKEHGNRLTFNEQNFPALGSETNIRVSFTSANCRPSTSNAANSTNISVQLSHNKAKSKNVREAPRNGVSASPMLSLTWVEKAKEKKPSPSIAPPTVPSEAVVKPPPLSRKNFPKLLNNGAESPAESPKKSKASVPIDNGTQHSRVNYSEVTSHKNSKGEEKKSAGGGGGKSKENSNESGSSKDSKSHGFLLNANRKKVKMKPEMFTNLNERASRSDSSPKQSSGGSVPSGSASAKPPPETSSKSKGNGTVAPVQRANRDSSDKKVKNVEKKTKEKPSAPVQSKVGKGKENVTARIKDDEKANLQNGGPEQPKEAEMAAKSGKSDVKTKRAKKKVESDGEPSSDVNDMRDDTLETIADNDRLTSVKAPPGFEKTKVPSAPPPGLAPLTNGCVQNCLRDQDTDSVLNSVISNSLFVFQEPENFGLRNVELREKINRSLTMGAKSTLDDFKNTSLLFQEGYITATIFYQYCRKSIGSDDFDNIFVDLVTLLPNILKQQVIILLRAISRKLETKAVQTQVYASAILGIKKNSSLQHLVPIALPKWNCCFKIRSKFL